MIAPLYDKLRFLKLVFGCGMKTLFLLCRKLHLLLENEEMEGKMVLSYLKFCKSKLRHYTDVYVIGASNWVDQEQ